MKLFVIFDSASHTCRKFEAMAPPKEKFLPIFGFILVAGGLLLLESDFASFAAIMSMTFCILFPGRIPVKHFLEMLALPVISFTLLMVTSPYRMACLLGFLNPWSDPLDKGHRLAHAVIGEDLGFAEISSVIMIVTLIVWQNFKMKRYFQSLVAQGIACWVSIQAAINIAVNVGLFPTKGLILPLVNYGDSSLIAGYIAIGVLLRIDYENRKMLSRRGCVGDVL